MIWQTIPFEDAIQKVKYPQKIAKKDFRANGEFPIISQESDFINGFWDNQENVFKVERPVVVFGDHTKVIKYVDFDFVLGADGVKILQPIEDMNARFLAYYLKSIELPSLGYARHYKLLKDLRLPIPPIEEQLKIVRRLEVFERDVSELRALTEQKLKLIDDMEKSVLSETINPGLCK